MLKLQELTKRHEGGFQLGPLNVEIEAGSTVAIFGQNGAGKSTLFSLISGNADRSSGHAYWNNHKISPDAVDVKRTMGYLPQESDLPAWVTPFEIIQWNAKLHNLNDDSIDRALSLWDCKKWSNRPLSACSHGMQKRIGLALATMHRPEFLILDEAFNALDILHTKTLENLIRDRSKDGLTTLISTHTPWIAAILCEKAWILDNGKLEVLTQWDNAGVESRVQIIEDKFFKANS